MLRVFLAALVILVGGTVLVVNYYSEDTARPGRAGVVLDSGRRSAVVAERDTRPALPAPVVAERDASASVPAVASVATPLPVVPSMRTSNRLVIGRISTNVRKHWPRLEAMANYLAAELADQGIAGIDVRLVDTLEEMQELFRSGEIDLVSETAFGAIELAQDGLAEMLLREWKSGVSAYSTVLFARRDSGIDSLDDLVGRSFVFEDRGSTSGYLVPRAFMAQAGYDLVELDDPLASPPAGSVGYAFAEDEEDVVSRVVRGFADVGAISNLDWADEDEVSEADKLDLVIVHETDPIIRSIMLVRSGLDQDIKTRLATVLERMHESEAGLETLREYWKVARFDRIEGAALDSLLTARVMHETFRSF